MTRLLYITASSLPYLNSTRLFERYMIFSGWCKGELNGKVVNHKTTLTMPPISRGRKPSRRNPDDNSRLDLLIIAPCNSVHLILLYQRNQLCFQQRAYNRIVVISVWSLIESSSIPNIGF